ncbi:MAG TPA: matrixin family metalloprotease, partial [Opitutus sp.]|nr:matrixin family metalloprotease [Opitutus sp.]
MTRAPRLHTVAVSFVSILVGTALSLFAPLVMPAHVPIDDGIYYGSHEALGISDDFGRFNSTIRLVYDPDGAPTAYSSNAHVLALLEEAFGYWTTVSGVQFEIAGIDTNALDDRFVSNPDHRDGLVRVSWGAIGSVAGQAGPLSGWYDDSLGYFPFEDGTIELNNSAGVISSDAELIAVLVHEIGHLLGLGHSDNPDSAMYANPYNFLRYPREDDIRAIQVLYGAPAVSIDVNSPVPQWIYTPPPQATSATTQFLFKPHANAASGAYFEVNDAPVTSVTANTPNNQYVWFVGALGGGGTAIAIDATFVVVDPSGYIYDERPWELACSASSICLRSITLADGRIMKTIPGTWKIYVIDNATNQTLVSASLPVNTVPEYNRAPLATITAVPGSTPASARFTLTATDPEGDGIEVVWHPPNLPGAAIDVRQTIASGGSATQTIDFALTGTHT